MVDFDIDLELDELNHDLKELVAVYREYMRRRDLLRRKTEHPEKRVPAGSTGRIPMS